MAGRLVWIRNSGNYAPQLWPDGGLGHAGNLGMGVVAAEFILGDADANLSLDELTLKYPAPDAVGEIIPPATPLPRPLMPQVDTGVA